MPERVKILFVLPSLGFGGAQRVSSHLLRYLDRTKFEPHVALMSLEGSYLQDLPKDVEVHEIGVSRARYALPGIVQIARKVNPKVILATIEHMNFCAVLAKCFLPRRIAVFVREVSPPTEIIKAKRYPILWRWMQRQVYRYADLVICPSDVVLADVTDCYRVPPQKAIRIYNPVDFGRVRESAEAGDSPYRGEGPHIVAVGRLAREKGFDLLVSAMPLVRKTFPEARLAILGQGALQRELEMQAGKLGLNGPVRFWGYQRNPWPFIKHADLFVLSSRYEGLPNAMLEALALNKWVVATDCPGGVAELQQYFPKMTLVPSENPEALAQAIVSTCQNLRHSAANGTGKPNEAAVAAFGLKSIVEQYSELFLR